MNVLGKFVGIVLMVVGVIVFASAISILMAFPIMWCWNYAVVAVFGLPNITWSMAWCLSFLASVFFKSDVTQNNKS